jgi:hypothetical protein
MTPAQNRRQFLRRLGLSTAALPFVAGLPSLSFGRSTTAARRQRLIVFFSPNGTLPDEFWPKAYGEDQPLQLSSMLSPLQPFADRTLILKGVHNQIMGDGDNHMRGMSCLLTATELSPGNIQGGGETPAGWASGPSIDQQIRNFWQAREESKTRFGSLEFGVAVPNRADPWTRMCYAGANRPVAPIDDPKLMFNKLYGGAQQRQLVGSVLDLVRDDLRRAERLISQEDRRLLDEHLQSVRQLELDIAAANAQSELLHPEPEIDPTIELVNDNTPLISRTQLDLLVNALANDMARVASVQYMRSVGEARMRWLGVEEGHHSLSHEPDNNETAYEKLKRINTWFAGELAYLAGRLAETPEPNGEGSMLDHTQIVWVNELGKGNSHTLSDIPFLLIGGGAGFKTDRALDLGGVPHNRLWLALGHAMGDVELQTFGSANYCEAGALSL